MGLYINMEMPKDKEIFLRIDEKGEAYVYGSYPTKLYKAEPLPPHGRLVDADALCKTLHSLAENEYTPEVFANWIENHIDTVISASEEGCVMIDWKSCDNCAFACGYVQKLFKSSQKDICEFWKPIKCKYCGGVLSEIRQHNGKSYRHCYACHFEFEEK